MAETNNISEIANQLSKDIFKHFLWQKKFKHDDNFNCGNPDHTSEGKNPKPKESHPGDVVFCYDDPYIGKAVYLHTDLKSYAKKSITSPKLRGAFKSLAMSIECARESEDWRKKYSVLDDEAHEVRGLLFVHNHDNKYSASFAEAVKSIDLGNLPIASGVIIHYLGPDDIQRLYSIGNDIIRLRDAEELPREYTFYYPDLVMVRRHGDGENQAATIESLTGPYLILQHGRSSKCDPGFVIYYNRAGSSSEEFAYFLDCLSRYQMLERDKKIRVRITSAVGIDDLKAVFDKAKNAYVKAWGFDDDRATILNGIQIDRIPTMTTTYNPGDMGWRS